MYGGYDSAGVQCGCWTDTLVLVNQPNLLNKKVTDCSKLSLHDQWAFVFATIVTVPSISPSATLTGELLILLLQSRRSSTAFEELQSELLKAQEKQRLETQQHFATQAEFQAAMKQQLQEQAKMQMMVWVWGVKV